MGKHPPTTSHNYAPRLRQITQKLLESGGMPPGSVSDIRVLHDTWCDALNGAGFCNCNPQFRLPDPLLRPKGSNAN